MIWMMARDVVMPIMDSLDEAEGEGRAKRNFKSGTTSVPGTGAGLERILRV